MKQEGIQNLAGDIVCELQTRCHLHLWRKPNNIVQSCILASAPPTPLATWTTTTATATATDIGTAAATTAAIVKISMGI